jgi:4a-hydroxytetrahydrobiopterin dehydratase
MAKCKMVDVPAGWEARGKPAMLFRRFVFANYSETRAFLDGLAALSEEFGMHPQNINFGVSYVNVTLEGAEGGDLAEAELSMATRINTLTAPTSGG